MLASAAMTELARVMADNPGGVIETVAKEHDVTPRAVVDGDRMCAGRAAPIRIGPTGSASPNTFTIW